MTLNRETLQVCLDLLGQITFSAQDPNLEEAVAQFVRVKTDLAAALEEVSDTDVPPDA